MKIVKELDQLTFQYVFNVCLPSYTYIAYTYIRDTKQNIGIQYTYYNLQQDNPLKSVRNYLKYKRCINWISIVRHKKCIYCTLSEYFITRKTTRVS